MARDGHTIISVRLPDWSQPFKSHSVTPSWSQHIESGSCPS